MNNAVRIIFLLIFLSGTLNGQTFFDRYDYSAEAISLINSSGSDISPAIVKGQLFFSSEIDGNTGQEEQRRRNDGFYNVYYSHVDMNGFPQMLRKPVNGLGNKYHEGPVAWCEATNELFVTVSNLSTRRSKRRTNNDNQVKLKIVIMKEVDETWKIVDELPFNQPEYHFAHPAISKTGDTLIFSSDMEGGFGNSDLYMTIRSNNEWSDPVNLGNEINTTGNEVFPTLGPNGLLMFSSNGHPDNLGGLDIYYTTISGGVPVNLGERINTEYDELGLVINPSREYGYFSSNRPGKGEDDLYRVGFTPLYEIIGGTVSDSYGMPVMDATVYLQDCNGKNLKSSTSTNEGRFQFEVLKDKCYQAVASKSGYTPASRPFQLYKNIQLTIVQLIKYNIITLDYDTGEGLSGVTINCDSFQWLSNDQGITEIEADSLKACSLIVQNENYFDYIIPEDTYRFEPGMNVTDTVRLFKKEPGKAYQLNNIVFFLDKWRLLPESETELRKVLKLMEDNPSLQVEIASHTDSRGEEKYNIWLSQKRSDSARDFLIENGIEKERIVSKGYGESRLLNHCANNVPCSEEEHLQNMRTEFIILDY